MAFDAVVPDAEEATEGAPEAIVLENARRKAMSGADRAPGTAPVLGVDTEVVVGGRVLGKAETEDEARERLSTLSGRTHAVLSGVVLLDPGSGGERSGVARSDVTFRSLDGRAIDLYVASGEWRDRAGAYAIQGLGSILVERVEGDFSNVVGLPVRLLLELFPQLTESLRKPSP